MQHVISGNRFIGESPMESGSESFLATYAPFKAMQHRRGHGAHRMYAERSVNISKSRYANMISRPLRSSSRANGAVI